MFQQLQIRGTPSILAPSFCAMTGGKSDRDPKEFGLRSQHPVMLRGLHFFQARALQTPPPRGSS